MPPRPKPKPAATAGVKPPLVLVNAGGQTQLLVAAYEGDIAGVRTLLASSGGGLLLDLQDNNGASPLFAACQEGHTEVVRALLSAGAKIDLRRSGGMAPLHVACGRGHTEVVRTMLPARAKVNLQTEEGASPLHVACQGGYMEVVRALLSAGANVGAHPCIWHAIKATQKWHAPCYPGGPRHWHKGHTEVVRALLSEGAKVDLLASDGGMPLHIACYCGHKGVVRALLSAGARADLCDTNGRTPLDLLPRTLRAEVERLLQQAKEERGGASSLGAALAAVHSAVPPPPPPHNQPASQLHTAIKDLGEGSSQIGGPGGLSAEASSSGGRAASGRVCSMCGGPPSATSGGVAKLRACGRCLSVRYCSQECQKKHWGEGGHKRSEEHHV